MSEADKATIRRIPLEVINEGRIDVIDDVLTGDYREHMPVPGFTPDREGLKGFLRAMRSAFPDIRYTVLREIAEGDTVVQYVSVTGTMRGDFAGMKATGKSATWTEMHIVHMRDGLAAEHWGIVDMLTMLQELGLVPAPGVAEAA